MQQRQLRLGDTLDDYCPRERRVTNHVVVAMVGHDVKQTRCTTCDADHEYKHAKVPRQRKKTDSLPTPHQQVPAGRLKRARQDGSGDLAPEQEAEASSAASLPPDAVEEPDVPHQSDVRRAEPIVESEADTDPATPETPIAAAESSDEDSDEDGDESERNVEEGPVHRPLIRATLPRPEGQVPPPRPAPEFTIRQPGGRANRFRPKHARGPQFGHRSNGNVGGLGSHGARGPHNAAGPRSPRRHDRKRSK